MPSETKASIPINVMPLQTIQLYIIALINGFTSPFVILTNLVGNIILTLPIGVILFRYIHQINKWDVAFFSIYIPCYIEFVQFLLHIIGYGTRSIDIDDVILNMIGIWLGVLFAKLSQKNLEG